MQDIPLSTSAIVLISLMSLCRLLPASPGCSLDDFTEHYIHVFENRQMIGDCYQRLINSMEKAAIAQEDIVTFMAEKHRVVGYKVGLTGNRARQMFAITQPLVGTLFEGMLLKDNAHISLESGTSLWVELDLMVRVKSARMNKATTIEEVAAEIDMLIPFIELPDALFEPGNNNAAALLLAGNVGARWGVMGEGVSITAPDYLVRRLPNMKLELITGTGESIRQGQGKQILAHPLNAVLYLLGELKKRNKSLVAGQLISLGTIGGPARAQQGTRYTARYSGFSEKALTVSVTVE